MCELMAVSCDRQIDISGYLKSFSTHSCCHPHGWGVALIDNFEHFAVTKEPTRADRSIILDHLTHEKLSAKTVLAHIRYATVGNVAYTNCHPYIMVDHGKTEWICTHNGTIFNSDLLAPYVQKQQGSTDSERMFLYLMDIMNSEIDHIGNLDSAAHFSILTRELPKLSHGNKLNMMMYDGRTLFVHTNMSGTLYYKNIDYGMVFCTSPLDDDVWYPVEMQRVHGFINGHQVFRSEKVTDEYFPSAAEEALLYRIFSQL